MKLGSRHNQHDFAKVPSVNTPRSNFNRSFLAKDTMNFDRLVPFFAEEILPGDSVNLNVDLFARLSTQIKPLMDNLYMDFHFFFVPNRLVWENWERFNGAQDNPSSSTDYLIPQVESGIATPFGFDSIADHFGIPPNINNAKVNALSFRMYNLIVNEWYRNQNLVNSLPVQTGDGPDAAAQYNLFIPSKRPDYFTSCLPQPQKGPASILSLGSSAPVVGTVTYNTDTTNGMIVRNAVNNGPTNGASFTAMTSSGVLTANSNSAYIDPNGRLSIVGTADLTTATAVTINAFRQAIMVQSLRELDNRGGTRYVEILKAHFNVISPDFRLQRPEFLGMATININQHVVAQNSESADTPQANLAAYSTASAQGGHIGFTKSFVEHGWVIGLCRARGEVTYQQGLNKMWSRRTRFDYFWPKLQELGEQAVLQGEIFYTGIPAQDQVVFGYNERFGDYRFRPSEIRGTFRSVHPQSLDVWHVAQEFGAAPVLNQIFINQDTPIDRNLVVTDEPHLLVDYWFNLRHARPMVAYPVPATLGNF